MIRFQDLASEFRACHGEARNVTLHVVTAPVGVVCFLSLLWHASPTATIALVALYLISLLIAVPWRLWAVTAPVLTALSYATYLLPLCLDAARHARVGEALLHWLTPKSGFCAGG